MGSILLGILCLAGGSFFLSEGRHGISYNVWLLPLPFVVYAGEELPQDTQREELDAQDNEKHGQYQKGTVAYALMQKNLVDREIASQQETQEEKDKP